MQDALHDVLLFREFASRSPQQPLPAPHAPRPIDRHLPRQQHADGAFDGGVGAAQGFALGQDAAAVAQQALAQFWGQGVGRIVAQAVQRGGQRLLQGAAGFQQGAAVALAQGLAEAVQMVFERAQGALEGLGVAGGGGRRGVGGLRFHRRAGVQPPLAPPPSTSIALAMSLSAMAPASTR